jgi:hypothetical protein
MKTVEELSGKYSRLSNDMIDVKSKVLDKELSKAAVNTSDVPATNEIKTKIEEVKSLTLEKQKLGFDTINHKFNEMSHIIDKNSDKIGNLESKLKIVSSEVDGRRADHLSAAPQTSNSNVPNYFMEFFVTLGSLMLIIFISIKLIGYLKYRNAGRMGLFKQSSLNTIQTNFEQTL